MNRLALLPALLAAGCLGLERMSFDTGHPVLDDTGPGVQEWDDLSVDPAAIDFGQIAIGHSASATVVLSYQGDADIIVSEAEVIQGGGTIVIQDVSSLPAAITAGEEVVVDLLFSPADEQSYGGSLSIVTDHATAGEITVPLEGTGYRDTSDTEEGADISVSPGSIDFGLVDTGTPQTRTLIVANIGTEAFFLTDIQSNHADVDWDFSEYMPLEFDPGESWEVTVEWTPSSNGLLNSTLDFLSDCPGEGTVSVVLEGESDDICDVCAPMISVDTGGDDYAMEFYSMSMLGSLGVDTQTIYVTNSGDQTLTVSQANLTNDWFATDGTFSIDSGSGSFSLEPWESYQLEISYTATGLAFDVPYEHLDQNILHIISDAANDADYEIFLSGTGV